MIPQNATLTTEPIEVVEQPSLTYRIDWKRGRIVGKTDGLEAVKQAVYKILHTDRFRHLIYTPDYGMEWDGLFGGNPVFVRAELKRRITEALLADDRIEDVQDFEMEFGLDEVKVRFTVVSTYGNYREEVIARV